MLAWKEYSARGFESTRLHARVLNTAIFSFQAALLDRLQSGDDRVLATLEPPTCASEAVQTNSSSRPTSWGRSLRKWINQVT